MRTLPWLRMTLVAAMLTCGVHDARSMTREDVFENLSPYIHLGQTITSANVYPNAPCYTGHGWSGIENDHSGVYGEHLPVGFWVGEVYGFSLWRYFYQVAGDLASGRGAGVYQTLFRSSPAESACAVNHLTGIDCSAFAGFGWGYTWKFGTCLFQDPRYGQPVPTVTDVAPGDVMAQCGHHVVIVYSSPDADNQAGRGACPPCEATWR